MSNDHEMENYKLAIHNYNKAIQLNPEYTDAYYKLGYIYEKIEQFDLAIIHYNKVIQLYPENEDALINLGNAYFKSKQFDLAIIQYNKAIQLNPRHAIAYHSLGWVYLLNNDLTKAEQALIQSHKLSDKTMANNLMNLGHIQLMKNHRADATKYYLESLQLWNDPKIFFDVMIDDYKVLKMESSGISKEEYDKILAQLKNKAL